MSEKIEFQLKVIEDQLSAVLKKNAGETKKVKEEVKSLSSALAQAGDQFGRIKASFIGNLGANAVTGAIGLLKSGFASVVSEAREFSRAIAEINSTLPKNAKLTNDQSLALAKVSERFGTSPTAQAKAFFEAVSNGVEDSSKAFGILVGANDAALSGLVDLNVATRLITATFNAYSDQGVTAAQITDTLVAVTQASGAKFEELANSMGRVTNVAAASGISIGELGGTIAFLNSRSLTTEQAITGIAGAIASVSKPTPDAAQAARNLGIEFSAAALKSKGLAGFLQEVSDKTQGNVASIRKLFPEQRAANAVIAIASGKFTQYAAVVDKVTNSQGEAARAASVIKESLDFKLSKAASEFNSLAISIGQKLTPAIDVATSALSLFRELVGGSPKSIDENRNRLSALSKEYNNVKTAIDLLSGAQSGSDSQIIRATQLIGSQADGEKRLNDILIERQKIRSDQSSLPVASVTKATGSTVDPEEEAAAIALRQDTFRQLRVAQTEFDVGEQERKLINLELGTAEGQLELDKLIAFERTKIDAKFAAEDEKNKLIEDSIAKENAIKATALKKEQEFAVKSSQITKTKTDAQNKLEQQSLQTRLGYIQAFGNLASAVAADGSKAQFVIQKASAIAGSIVATQLAMAQALAVPPAPNAPLALTAKTIGAINTAAIVATSIKGFAEGGIIGGISGGATGGADNRLATVRDGEMVLNAGQQEKLFNAINSGSFGGGDIIVQVDSREIARAVRSQVQSGFKLGA